MARTSAGALLICLSLLPAGCSAEATGDATPAEGFDKPYAPQGYTFSAGFFTSRDVWIKEDPQFPLPEVWDWAVLHAAAAWGQAANVNYHFDWQNAPAERITTISYRPSGSSPTCAYAFGSVPVFKGVFGGIPVITPGPTVDIYSNHDGTLGSCCPSSCAVSSLDDLTQEQRVKIVAHELGHTLGLAHPGDAFLVPGTATAPPASSGCTPRERTYASVMWNGCVGGMTTMTPSADDVASANFLMP